MVGEQPGFKSPPAGAVLDGLVHAELGEVGVFQGRVVFAADGAVLDEDFFWPFETWIDSAALPDGEVLLTATLHDGAGEELLGAAKVVLDNQPPTIESGADLPNRCVAAGVDFTLRARADDDVGVSLVQMRQGGVTIASTAAPVLEHGHRIEASDLAALTENGQVAVSVAAQNARGRIANQELLLPVCP
jgi:hypothetical protein